MSDSVPNVSDSIPKVSNSVPNVSNLPVRESSDEQSELADRAELQIINLCTEVPTFYDELINTYSREQSPSAEGLQRIKSIEAKLKSKTDELRQYVSEYDERISSTDPDAETIQNLMSSAVDELVQSVNKINDDLNTEISQTVESSAVNVDDRAQVIQQYVRPAMVKFEESCLLQTKDILKNVLQDYEASLHSQ